MTNPVDKPHTTLDPDALITALFAYIEAADQRRHSEIMALINGRGTKHEPRLDPVHVPGTAKDTRLPPQLKAQRDG